MNAPDIRSGQRWSARSSIGTDIIVVEQVTNMERWAVTRADGDAHFMLSSDEIIDDYVLVAEPDESDGG